MAAICSTRLNTAAAPRLARKATVSGVSRPVARKMSVRASAQKEAALPVAVMAAAGAVLANPLAAQAAVTPSLQNFLYSLLAGGTVLAVIAGAITVVSNFDPVSRE